MTKCLSYYKDIFLFSSQFTDLASMYQSPNSHTGSSVQYLQSDLDAGPLAWHVGHSWYQDIHNVFPWKKLHLVSGNSCFLLLALQWLLLLLLQMAQMPLSLALVFNLGCYFSCLCWLLLAAALIQHSSVVSEALQQKLSSCLTYHLKYSSLHLAFLNSLSLHSEFFCCYCFCLFLCLFLMSFLQSGNNQPDQVTHGFKSRPIR